MADESGGASTESQAPVPFTRSDIFWSATALVALAIVLFLTVINWRGVEEANDRMVESRDQVGTLRRILRLIDDAETGQRGYLLTGEERYLAPYTNAVGRLPDVMAGLTREWSGTRYAGDFSRMVLNVNAKLAELAEAIRLRRAAGFLQALAFVRTDRGLLTMNEIVNASASLEQSARTEMVQRTSEVARRAKDAAIVTSAACVTLFILLALANLQLRRQRATAEAANQAKSAFLASMSHELRTPLNAIIGYSEMLVDEAADAGQEALTGDLNKIQAAGRHLLLLINSVLDFSKIEAGKMDVYLEIVDVSALTREVAGVIQPLAEKNQNRLQVEVDHAVGTIQTDQTKLRQTLYNLLSNACKFTQEGSINLSVRSELTGGKDAIVFEVTDTGIGITPEQLEKIFKPFTQADSSTTRKFGGTGLGLSICQRFVEMMGGQISVLSKPGEGSKFTVRLPRKGTEGVAAQKPAGLEASTAEDVILIIDDEANVRDLLSRTLVKYGFSVHSASTGEEGIRLARKLHPAAITLDVMMPGMDGWTVLSKLKADSELAEIPVVMLTIADNRNLGYTLGATDYLSKPVDRQKLLPILMRYRTALSAPSALIVEDDTDSRLLLKRALEAEGWEVQEAENGRIALDLIAESQPTVILLDLMMPEMDGFDFVLELRRRPEGKNTPIIVVTARDLTAEDRLRLNGQVSRILQKDAFDMEDLLPEVSRLVVSRIKMRK